MKFGNVLDPLNYKLSLPDDHLDTARILNTTKGQNHLNVHVGCPVWNRTNLKGFYPRGTKDELHYYSRQFNAIELNATFYRIFPAEQFAKWYDKTPDGFKFFPKLNQEISHWKRLKQVDSVCDQFLYNVSNLKEKLGMCFLQLPSNFSPKDVQNLEAFISSWPDGIELAIEFRHPDWFTNTLELDRMFHLMEQRQMTTVLTDALGRRDVLHMRLTNSKVMLRYVGSNHESDYTRLDDWVLKLKEWNTLGMTDFNIFIHQNVEKELPLLSSYFIKKLNAELGCNLKVPNEETGTLF